MNTMTPFLVFSAYDKNLSQGANEANHIQMVAELSKAFSPHDDFIQGLGAYTYEGDRYPTVEQSVALFGHNNEQVAREICLKYNQECYMYVDANYQASLHKPDGTFIEQLGTFRQVLPEIAQAVGNYSVFNGKHYICGTVKLAPDNVPGAGKPLNCS